MRGCLARAIDLVVDRDLRQVSGADRIEHVVDLRDALGALRIRGVDDVQQQVRLARFLQRRAERRHELVRQVADETRPYRRAPMSSPGASVQAAHRRVERREQLVGGIRVRRGQPIEQRRLAGIRVADQRNRRHGPALPLAPRGVALHEHLVEAVVERLDAAADQAAVGLELRFTRTAQTDAALLALEVGPAAHQARRQVLELRELDLQLAFEAARALREDVEDQAAAIEHAALEFLLEVAFLAGRERVIDQHEVGAESPRRARAAPRPCRCRAGNAGPPLLRVTTSELEHLRAGRLRERGEFLDAIGLGCTTEPDADEDGAFAAARSVDQVVLVLLTAGQAGGASSAASSSDVGRRTLRAGTTVEIACL